MRKSTRQTKKLALSAMFTALGVAILYMGCFIEVMELTVAAVAAILILLAVIEMGKKAATLIWLATSILSVLLLPTKFIALEYAFFIGSYPLIKALAERFSLVASWVIKIVFVNLALGLLIVLGHYVFGYPLESLWMIIATFLLASVTGVIFDIALTRLVTLYLERLRRTLRIDRLLK